MRVHTNVCLAVLAAFGFAIPVWGHGLSATVNLENPATIGSTTLKPGNYRVVVDGKTNEVQVVQDGHVLATVPGRWVSLKNKAPYTAVILSKNQIQEIDFSGKTQAIRVE